MVVGVGNGRLAGRIKRKNAINGFHAHTDLNPQRQLPGADCQDLWSPMWFADCKNNRNEELRRGLAAD